MESFARDGSSGIGGMSPSSVGTTEYLRSLCGVEVKGRRLFEDLCGVDEP
jgi:hypothetical protein